MPQSKKNILPIVVGTVIFGSAILGAGWILVSNSNASTPQSQNSRTITPPTVNTVSNTKYKNGTYTKTASYFSPGGEDTMGVSLTINQDKVTGVTITPQSRGTSGEYQHAFADVVGKSVVGLSMDSDFNFSNTSGASLTQQTFIDAVAQIKIQAKV